MPIKTVKIDRLKLLQIISNIVKNALESLLLSTKKNEELIISIKEKDELHFMIQIADTGIGISPENIEKIFSYDYSVKKIGYGVELHTSANFVNEMGGFLAAESKGDKKGSVFTLTFPYEPPKHVL
jgi:signal transduction histidine kinase